MTGGYGSWAQSLIAAVGHQDNKKEVHALAMDNVTAIAGHCPQLAAAMANDKWLDAVNSGLQRCAHFQCALLWQILTRLRFSPTSPDRPA
jgi:hypothetical protein